MKAVIFDMDGLMIDSERLYFQVERDIAGKFNRTVKDETLWKMMGKKPIESLQILVKELDIPVSAEDALAMRNIMMREKLQNDLVAMPGLEHIIDAFYKRLKMAISTGASREFLDLMLDRLNIRDRFDALITSDDIEKGKPDPEIYLKTCQKLALKPEQCVVLEDSSNGARAGKRAGCYVIAVPSEYTKEQDFSFVDFIAGDLFAAEKHIADMAA